MLRTAGFSLSFLLLAACVAIREAPNGQAQVLASPVVNLRPAAIPLTSGHALAFTSEQPWTVKGIACQRLEVALEYLPATPGTIAGTTDPDVLEKKLWHTPVFCLRLDYLAANGKGVTWFYDMPATFPSLLNTTLWITSDGRVLTTVGAVQMTNPAFIPVVAVDLTPALLLARRAADPACATVRSGLGSTTCWASFSEVMNIGTLAIYLRDPAIATTPAEGCPDTVWFLGMRRDGSWLPTRPDQPYILGEQPCGPPVLARNADGVLTGVTLSPWCAPIDPLLDGEDADFFLVPRQAQVPAEIIRSFRRAGASATHTATADVPVARVSIEALANERLVDWKGRELGERLSGPGAKRAGELAIRLEKGLLRLDLKVRQLKDAVDAEARKPGGSAPRTLTDRCHLLEQRKALLTAALQMIRRAAAAP